MLTQWFSTGDSPASPQCAFGNVCRCLWLYSFAVRGGGGGCYWHLWIEARGAAQHSAIHRQQPQLRIAQPRMSEVQC